MRTLLLALALFTSHAFASDKIALRIQSEYQRLRAMVTTLTPEFVVGGYLQGKQYGDHKILWHLAEEKGDSEVIRIFRKKSAGQDFDVTFHHNDVIIRGRTVIRRFVGPSSTGWRNDTIDALSGEYLGSQGTERPYLDARDQEILWQWGIELPR